MIHRISKTASIEMMLDNMQEKNQEKKKEQNSLKEDFVPFETFLQRELNKLR